MPFEKERFHPVGKPWSELASQGELDAVITGNGNIPRNVFLNHVQLFAARKASKLFPRNGRGVDFGCGTGRFVRFFGGRGHSVLGTEITQEMLDQAKHFGIPKGSELTLTDGINIPVADATIDFIWACGVLRFSLNVPDPVYDQIAREMYRVLKPGGRVVDLEMYVIQPASDFTRDFELAGFHTDAIKIVNRHGGRFEKFAQRGWLPLSLVPLAANLAAFRRYYFEPTSANAITTGLRDYLLIWRKE
jgi:ubiquinone/menaquinone biosynthesis C-methylase UbiE